MYLDNVQVCNEDLDASTLARYLAYDAIAIDTETMGLVLGRDRLCLVQLCDPQGYVTTIRIARDQTAAPNLAKLLTSWDVTKVFHYARFDVAVLLELTPLQFFVLKLPVNWLVLTLLVMA